MNLSQNPSKLGLVVYLMSVAKTARIVLVEINELKARIYSKKKEMLKMLCGDKLQTAWYNYTERDSKIGFGLMRKLSGFNDRKWFNIRNMDPFTTVESGGFGTTEISIFEPRSV